RYSGILSAPQPQTKRLSCKDMGTAMAEVRKPGKAKSDASESAMTGNGTADSGVASAPASGGAPQLDPEVAKKVAALRAHVRESFGKVVMAMMMMPRYRHQTLADLQHRWLEPLIRDRIAFAYAGKEQGPQSDIAGVAIWASVSDEVDAEIRQQIKAGVFPVRLKADAWNSGKTNWLIDVIASD